MPRYSPKYQNTLACSTMTVARDSRNTVKNAAGASRLKRSQNASHHAIADAATSCTNAARVRGLIGFSTLAPGAWPIEGAIQQQCQQGIEQRHRRNDNSLNRRRLIDAKNGGDGAGRHQGVFGQCSVAVAEAGAHQPLVIMLAVRAPEALAA